ncbi:hypothetical protein GTP46_05580 [Duganella sp. FT135W]|uniref:O-antigen ligase domain-containing protein n=1 Tax=Duganella flavida TaxID=2692175 RepID=A0A6L8K897_9BURK|nr:hypothetical protein [Duganella flavida]MYM22112.1 hypothetical protein [Duganella flavida]
MQMSWARLLALIFFAGFALAASMYPMAGTWLLPILATYAAWLCWRPALWLVSLLALLPVLDFTPHTGWFFLEEIDLLLLLTAGLAYWHLPPNSDELPRWPPLFRLGLVLMGLAVAIGMWRGLQPLGPVDANTFNNYLSSANALRVGKAWVWTVVLLPPLRRSSIAPREQLVAGMMLGLLLVSTAAINERMQFTGLLNFSTDYRISAPFSAMHTGGAALDGYLALSIPLLATWLLARNATWRNAAALALLPLAWYVALATFSRGLYLALAAALLVLAAPMLMDRLHGGAPRAGWIGLAGAVLAVVVLDLAFRFGGYRAYLPVLMALLLLAAAHYRHHLSPTLASLLLLGTVVPICHGYYVNVRFASIGNDWATRLHHWKNTLAMMDADANLLGMGIGKFPATYYWYYPQRELPPSYQFIDQGSNRHLRLSAGQYAAGYGELLRMLQSIQLRPHQQYALGVDVWNGGPPAFLHINVCQRQLLYPQNCLAVPLRQIPHGSAWQHYLYTIDSGVLGGDQLPVKLEIAAEGQLAVLDIDNLSLRTVPDGHELLRNGSFSEANTSWFFSSDRNHLPWHVKNLVLNLYFEMGWAGLCAYGLLLFSAVAVLLRRGDSAMLAALLAFQLVGLFDSLLDVPRITLLSMLLLSTAALPSKGSL